MSPPGGKTALGARERKNETDQVCSADVDDVACQWEGVSDEVFMALILDDAVMAGISGVVRYRDEFDEAM